jgi:hypothetical protein
MDKERTKSILTTGTEIAGAAVGGAIGFIAGGPGAAAGAGILGVGVTKVLQDVCDRVLSNRESVRIGATASFAICAIKEKVENGRLPRDDGFFGTNSNGRNSADEIFEGVLLAAKNSHEEKKAKYLGNLFANIAFDPHCPPSEANYLIKLTEALTFSQLVLLRIFATQEVFTLRPESYSKAGQVSFSTLAALEEIQTLCYRNLAQMQKPGDPHYTIILGINEICPSHMKLAASGKRLFHMLNLQSMPVEDVAGVVEHLK